MSWRGRLQTCRHNYSGSTSSSSCCLGPERRRGNFKRAGMFGGGSAARRRSCSARVPDGAAHMPACLNLLRRLRWRGRCGRGEVDSAYACLFKVDHQTWPPHLRFPNSSSATPFRADWVAVKGICSSEVCRCRGVVDFKQAGICRIDFAVFLLSWP